MLWHIASWIIFIAVFLFFFGCVVDIVGAVQRFFNRDEYTSVEQSINLMYHSDPTAPELGATRNAEQHRQRR